MSIVVDEHDPIYDVDDAPFEPRDVQVRKDTWVTSEFIILDLLGRGKFGEVKRCQEKKSMQYFAAKFITTSGLQDKKDVLHEIDIMKKLQHNRLLQLYDAFEAKDEMCLILEIILGGELFDRVIDDDFVLTERAVIVFMRQICEGLDYMHIQNIIHLDMKPENILCLTREGNRIKIIDFGLAREYHPKKDLRVLFGTPEFMAPEVVQYDPINYCTDMWSVGVICYVLLSGLSPFMGNNDAETLTNVIKGRYDFDYPEFEDVTECAKDFISSLLVKEKEKRMTAADCLEHPWLRRETRARRQLSKKRLRKFVIRRKWQKVYNAMIALKRMGVPLRSIQRDTAAQAICRRQESIFGWDRKSTQPPAEQIKGESTKATSDVANGVVDEVLCGITMQESTPEVAEMTFTPVVEPPPSPPKKEEKIGRVGVQEKCMDQLSFTVATDNRDAKSAVKAADTKNAIGAKFAKAASPAKTPEQGPATSENSDKKANVKEGKTKGHRVQMFAKKKDKQAPVVSDRVKVESTPVVPQQQHIQTTEIKCKEPKQRDGGGWKAGRKAPNGDLSLPSDISSAESDRESPNMTFFDSYMRRSVHDREASSSGQSGDDQEKGVEAASAETPTFGKKTTVRSVFQMQKNKIQEKIAAAKAKTGVVLKRNKSIHASQKKPVRERIFMWENKSETTTEEGSNQDGAETGSTNDMANQLTGDNGGQHNASSSDNQQESSSYGWEVKTLTRTHRVKIQSSQASGTSANQFHWKVESSSNKPNTTTGKDANPGKDSHWQPMKAFNGMSFAGKETSL